MISQMLIKGEQGCDVLDADSQTSCTYKIGEMNKDDMLFWRTWIV